MNISTRVLVYGAYGHTGRFVVDELLRRGLVPVLAGRSPGKLEAYAVEHPGLETRVADLGHPRSLDQLVEGAAAVVNCAGPFLDTAVPLARAAVAAGAHYLDVTAEQASVQAVYVAVGEAAKEASVGVVPAMAFYGGLADLLTTAAIEGWERADEVTVAIALDRWWPTAGTRTTGRRNTASRLVVSDGRLVPLPEPPPTATWDFPEPFGNQPVTAMPFSEVVTIASHLRVGELRSYLNTAPLADLHDPNTPPPSAADASGRSAQRFAVDIVVRSGAEVQRITASGRDIYAVTAPIVVEGALRLISGQALRFGAGPPGEIFDAGDVLRSLARDVSVIGSQAHPDPAGVDPRRVVPDVREMLGPVRRHDDAAARWSPREAMVVPKEHDVSPSASALARSALGRG